MSVVLATGSYDHKIRFFEAPSGVNSKTLRAGAPVNCLEITPNKQFIAAGCRADLPWFLWSLTPHQMVCEGVWNEIPVWTPGCGI